MSNSLRSFRLWPARFLYPWDSLGKNTGVGYHALLQRISQPRDWAHVSCVSCTTGRFFTSEPSGKPWKNKVMLIIKTEENWIHVDNCMVLVLSVWFKWGYRHCLFLEIRLTLSFLWEEGIKPKGKVCQTIRQSSKEPPFVATECLYPYFFNIKDRRKAFLGEYDEQENI